MDSKIGDIKIKENICNFLKEGMFRKDAAVMAGISEATFYRWVNEDESFESRVEASILDYKHTLIKNLTVCAERDGRLALDVLKRRYPREWGDNTHTLITTQEMNNERRGVVALLEAVYKEETLIEAESVSSNLTPRS